MTKNNEFNIGKVYDRREIAEKLGGNYQRALQHTNGKVTAGCYDPGMNPNAPGEILVGRGTEKEHYSEQLANEKYSIPVFLKRGNKGYEFIGYYQALRYSIDPKEIEQKNNTDRNNDDIAGVLYFEEAVTV
ncbi:MAG TPA: hypothetical protein VK308_16880 [Pyrinomonadaceae bacterium]|nr:hypothetical protein [Pyrinomonadaceae bacterium]